jgi:hypothetical protein
MISIGSWWKHEEGIIQQVLAVGDDWVEPANSGRWPLVDFEARWTQQEPPSIIVARPSNDDSFSAGYREGARMVGAEMIRILNSGIVPLTGLRILEIEIQLRAIAESANGIN